MAYYCNLKVILAYFPVSVNKDSNKIHSLHNGFLPIIIDLTGSCLPECTIHIQSDKGEHPL